IAQAGGLGLAGAFTYVGANQFTYRCAEAEGEYRSSRPSRLVSEPGLGFVDYEVGLQARVNGKRGRAWTLIIAYEPDDTYTVWLVEAWRGRKADSMVLACHRDVYCDTLQSVIESTYDEAIREHNGGWIPLS
ncbi:MAG: hypothetical protein KJ072_22335, partial [Verrucomicrobia bacterium]|nr:hypothetical protein [Verrucomicrobiota bacterium]